jgi:hypothetical protein
MKYTLVTFDGCCYFSLHSNNMLFAYDFEHVNSVFRFFVLNRSVTLHSMDSFVSFYLRTLSLPLDEYVEELQA